LSPLDLQVIEHCAHLDGLTTAVRSRLRQVEQVVLGVDRGRSGG
jgi:hypothetical protein